MSLADISLSLCAPMQMAINCLSHMHYLNFRPPHIKDLEALEPAFYNSLVWIQENDPEPLDLMFTVEEVNIASIVGQLVVQCSTT